ncbi:MAG: hypothetical protein WKF59_08195 [Chitinophagaceae bacterium]
MIKININGDVENASLQYQLNSDISFQKHLSKKAIIITDLDAAAFTDEKDFTAKNKSLITGAGFNYQKE